MLIKISWQFVGGYKNQEVSEEDELLRDFPPNLRFTWLLLPSASGLWPCRVDHVYIWKNYENTIRSLAPFWTNIREV